MFQSVTDRMAVQEQVTARAALLEDLLARLPLEASNAMAKVAAQWATQRAHRPRAAHAFLRVGLMNPDNQIVILLPGQFRMQNSKPIPSGA